MSEAPPFPLKERSSGNSCLLGVQGHHTRGLFHVTWGTGNFLGCTAGHVLGLLALRLLVWTGTSHTHQQFLLLHLLSLSVARCWTKPALKPPKSQLPPAVPSPLGRAPTPGLPACCSRELCAPQLPPLLLLSPGLPKSPRRPWRFTALRVSPLPVPLPLPPSHRVQPRSPNTRGFSPLQGLPPGTRGSWPELFSETVICPSACIVSLSLPPSGRSWLHACWPGPCARKAPD